MCHPSEPAFGFLWIINLLQQKKPRHWKATNRYFLVAFLSKRELSETSVGVIAVKRGLSFQITHNEKASSKETVPFVYLAINQGLLDPCMHFGPFIIKLKTLVNKGIVLFHSHTEH